MFAGDLPAEQKEKLFEQAVRPKLEVGQNNVNGGILYYVVKFDWPSFPDCAMELQTPMVCIDGKEVDLPNKPDFGSTAFIGEIAMSSGSWYRHPTAGSHELEVTLRMQLYRERIGSIPVYDINRKLTAGFEIPIAKPNPTSINH
jgi:hypothetical protein